MSRDLSPSDFPILQFKNIIPIHIFVTNIKTTISNLKGTADCLLDPFSMVTLFRSHHGLKIMKLPRRYVLTRSTVFINSRTKTTLKQFPSHAL